MTPLFGRRDDGQRSAAEREAARLERERRRAEREGRPLPEEPAADAGAAEPVDEPAPFTWDAPGDGALDPNVSAPRVWDPEEGDEPEPERLAEPARFEEPEPFAEPESSEERERDPFAGQEPESFAEHDRESFAGQEPESFAEHDRESFAGQEPESLAGRERAPFAEPKPEAPEPEPEPFAEHGRESFAGQEPEPFAEHDRESFAEPEPEPFAEEEPERFGAGEPDPEPAAWSRPPADARPDPRAQAWQRRSGPGAAAAGAAAGAWSGGNGDVPAPSAHDARTGRAPEADAVEAGGEVDPQATQPFDPVAGEGPRRTVSLPRPQTDTGEWDAPIGTVRVSRGSGGGGSGPYQTQPGAPGYPPYRKLAVKPRRRWLRRIVVLLALGLAIAAAAFAFLLFQPFHGDGSGTAEVVVPAGATADQIGDMLAAQGVVRSGRLFAIRARLSGERDKLRSGRYALKKGMPYGAALTALTTPPTAAPVIHVTVPEGPSRREEAPKLEAAGLKGDYLAATRRSSKLNPRTYGAPRFTRSLEGFLYPATYELRQSQATSRRLVNRQLDAFKSNFANVNLGEARRKNLSRYDVLIIASMIEREALVPRDRRLISAVIYNRLKEGIPVGIDATLRYALNQWTRPLRVSELNSNSAFNTRKHRGLPPTPIGNPGLAAMKAAANPANVSYLFYVVKPCGNGAHAFSSTNATFQKDVAKYNRARAKRGGKDPSRC